MLYSIALILLLGLFLGFLCKKLHLPSLLGMLLVGILCGPYVFGLIDDSILQISTELRKIALIIILTRAGFGFDVKSLKKLGRPAILMCFLPASLELLGILLLGPFFLGLTTMEAAILGAVLAAVSPAVVVPRMVKLMEEEYGTEEGIPQLILAGASADDVYVIALFTTFLGMAKGESISVLRFVNIPFSIAVGIGIGFLSGWLLSLFFQHVHMRDTVKIIIVLSCSFLLVALENVLTTNLTFSSLIAIMFLGVAMQQFLAPVAKRLSERYNKLWVAAEILLFVLVGASVNISYLGHVGGKALLLIVCALLFRMVGVFFCLLGTKIGTKERIFMMLAYTPKATVQAAIGGLPLAAGLACGDTVLATALLAIVVTAPLGAFAIDLSYRKLLQKAI